MWLSGQQPLGKIRMWEFTLKDAMRVLENNVTPGFNNIFTIFSVKSLFKHQWDDTVIVIWRNYANWTWNVWMSWKELVYKKYLNKLNSCCWCKNYCSWLIYKLCLCLFSLTVFSCFLFSSSSSLCFIPPCSQLSLWPWAETTSAGVSLTWWW